MATDNKKKRPPGRPKGSKNKWTQEIIQKILRVDKRLTKEGKGLQALARKDPNWFYQHFMKNLIPKNVQLDHNLDVKAPLEFHIHADPKPKGKK